MLSLGALISVSLKVKPGDVLEMECTLTKQKGPIGIGDAVAKVNGKVVCKAELIFAVQ